MEEHLPTAIEILADQFPTLSVRSLRAFVEQGGVLLDGRRIATNTPVPQGTTLEVVAPLPPPDYVPTPVEFDVLYEDEWLLVVAKPAGVSTVPTRNGEVSLLEGILHRYDQAFRPHVVHRLDRDTSGVLVIAKDRHCAAELSRAFFDRQVTKEYYAFVHGTPHPEKGRIDTPIVVPSQGKRPKEAETEYELVESYGPYSLLLVRPRTGRMHQIRIHLRSLGHPLLVDPHYGGLEAFYLSSIKRHYKKSSRREERPIVKRLTLHSWRLTLTHPYKKETFSWEAPLPKDLAILQKHLRKYGKGKGK